MRTRIQPDRSISVREALSLVMAPSDTILASGLYLDTVRSCIPAREQTSLPMASRLLMDRSWEQKFHDLVDDQSSTATPYSRVNVLEIDLPKTSSQFAGPRAYSEDILRVERSSTSAVRIIFAPLDYPT